MTPSHLRMTLESFANDPESLANDLESFANDSESPANDLGVIVELRCVIVE
jgi:hypothetical protein